MGGYGEGISLPLNFKSFPTEMLHFGTCHMLWKKFKSVTCALYTGIKLRAIFQSLTGNMLHFGTCHMLWKKFKSVTCALYTGIKLRAIFQSLTGNIHPVPIWLRAYKRCAYHNSKNTYGCTNFDCKELHWLAAASQLNTEWCTTQAEKRISRSQWGALLTVIVKCCIDCKQ